MRIVKRIVAFIFVISSFTGWSQNAEAYARLDSSIIMIGDQVELELGIRLPENFAVSFPFFQDTLTSHIEILKKQPLDTTKVDGGQLIKQLYTITSFDSGYFALPEFEFMFHHKEDTILYRSNANALYLMVNTPVVDTSQAFKAIKGPVKEPYTFWEVFPWIALGLIVAGLILFAIWYIRKRRKNQPVFVRKPKPALPPGVLAIQKLEELRLAKVWQQGKLKEYHTQLTDIAREYFEGRYHFDALEMTSDEIMENLLNLNKNKEANEKMRNVLQLADLVKFAKALPTPLENDLSLNHVVDFVNETKLVPQQEPENSNELDTPTKKEA
jgi:hypothetical protein